MPAENLAAKLIGRPGRLQVGPAAYPTPGPHQVIVANAAVAINPVDWIIQISRAPVYPWITDGAVLGTDCAGVVVALGDQVSRFAVGDRVAAFALGTEKDHNDPAEGAFQLYSAVSEHLATPIPQAMSFAAAAVLPLGISTAACGLFQRRQLGMQHPSAAPAPTGETLLVWGGSTSVGAQAIQLAVAAGYEVVTTCSPANDALVASLGARASFDYHRSDVVAQITDALKGRQVAGAISLGTGSAKPCFEILSHCQGNRFVAQAAPPISMADMLAGPRARFILGFARAGLGVQVSAMTHRVRTRFIQGASLARDEVGPAIWETFLPAALAEGRYVPAPEPHVVGHGLESIQAALDAQRAGVSAQKLVVTLGDA